MKVLFGLGLLALLPLAVAAEEGGTAACRTDAQQYCASAGNKMECLIDHQKDISDACYNVLKTSLQRQRGIQACKSDAQKLCSGVGTQGGAMKSCLIDHQKELSDDCYNVLKNQQGHSSTQTPEPSTASAAPASQPIYKVKTADGHTVYTNAPLSGAQEVRLDRVIDSVPIESSGH